MTGNTTVLYWYTYIFAWREVSLHPLNKRTKTLSEKNPKEVGHVAALHSKTSEKGKFPYLKLIQYLCIKRGIEKDIVFDLIEKQKIYQDVRNNVVFVGYDKGNVPRFASVRGTGDKLFRMDCKGFITQKDLTLLTICCHQI